MLRDKKLASNQTRLDITTCLTPKIMHRYCFNLWVTEEQGFNQFSQLEIYFAVNISWIFWDTPEKEIYHKNPCHSIDVNCSISSNQIMFDQNKEKWYVNCEMSQGCSVDIWLKVQGSLVQLPVLPRISSVYLLDPSFL